jgi:hypothetical protein
LSHEDAPQSGCAGHQATYVPIFFANDSNESFLRRISALKKIAAQERFDFGDSKIRVGVNQSESKQNQNVWQRKVMHRHIHRQSAMMDMRQTLPCVALGRA